VIGFMKRNGVLSATVTNHRLMPGSVFNGRYTIHRVLGQGAMGIVYEATDQRSGQACALKLMNLESHADAFPHQLSGGMQQRVAIARAYVLDPEVLLMDEPFGALDAQTRVVMQEELVRLARVNPRTVLFITHAVEEAVYLADRVAIMTRRPGRIKEVLDIRKVREAENWDRMTRIEDVMDLESFVHLRTQIWKSLREEKGANSV
jgi:NitT/TauT family transport system ATP-binding protein